MMVVESRLREEMKRGTLCRDLLRDGKHDIVVIINGYFVGIAHAEYFLSFPQIALLGIGVRFTPIHLVVGRGAIECQETDHA